MGVKVTLPSVAALELTYRCNHQCIFCSCPWEANTEYKAEEMTLEEWKTVIDILIDRGVNSFTLTGGEPLLKDELKDIIDYIMSRGKPLTLISNGRKMDDDFLDFLSSRKVSLCISIPGIDSFEEHTGIDNVEHVLSLFERTKLREIHTTANIAVTKKNIGELYENIAYPLIKGADYILLNRFLPGGRGLNNSEFLLNKEELNLMLDTAEEVLEKAKRYGHVGTELPLCAIDHPEKYKRIQVSTLCSAAKGFFVVDPSGYIKVCNHSPQRICRYTEIDSLLTSDYWRSFQESAYIPSMCKDCDKRDRCDGGCREAAHVYNGHINDSDPILSTD